MAVNVQGFVEDVFVNEIRAHDPDVWKMPDSFMLLSTSCADAFAMNEWPDSASVKERSCEMTGGLPDTVTIVELALATPAQVVLVEYCSQVIAFDWERLPLPRVLDEIPTINELSLYQANDLALSFSASESGSEKIPGLQVRVEVALGVEGVMWGGETDGNWLGKAFEPDVDATEALASVNVIVTDAVAGVSPEQR